MEIREANDSDIPGIVELLRLSLGESLMPKSEKYWLWKHIDNPFGRSPVLLAVEDREVVGVRAFMRWTWHHRDQVYTAVRAVDTATHPAHQGKGIFKKLTLKLVDQCTRDGVNFVFNTPNASSKPGYLKMGWKEAGKLPLCIKLNRPVSIVLRLVGAGNGKQTSSKESKLDYFIGHAGLAELLRKDNEQRNAIHTQATVSYLKWRYKEVEVAQYFAEGIEKNGELKALCIFRLKPGKAGVEFRITDVFIDSEKTRGDIVSTMKAAVNSHGAEVATVSADNNWLLKSITTISSARIGPIVTVRDLDCGPLHELLGFQSWTPSLGDLELF